MMVSLSSFLSRTKAAYWFGKICGKENNLFHMFILFFDIGIEIIIKVPAKLQLESKWW